MKFQLSAVKTFFAMLPTKVKIGMAVIVILIIIILLYKPKTQTL